jgi:hypothetical protein
LVVVEVIDMVVDIVEVDNMKMNLEVCKSVEVVHQVVVVVVVVLVVVIVFVFLFLLVY